jgi:hypothetical protein
MRQLVETGRRYRATLRLGFFEGVASNATVGDKFISAGFVQVQVWGSGRDRFVDGTWPGESVEADLPDQIVKVEVFP